MRSESNRVQIRCQPMRCPRTHRLPPLRGVPQPVSCFASFCAWAMVQGSQPVTCSLEQGRTWSGPANVAESSQDLSSESCSVGWRVEAHSSEEGPWLVHWTGRSWVQLTDRPWVHWLDREPASRSEVLVLVFVVDFDRGMREALRPPRLRPPRSHPHTNPPRRPLSLVGGARR